MRSRLCAVLGLAGLVLVATGCVSLKRTPDARFFVLESQSWSGAPSAPLQPVGLVGVEMVRLPGHLDRPQLVTWTASDELRVDEFLRWAEPLEDGITRTLYENLAGLLPQYEVIQRPWPGGAHTRCRVALTLRVFGLQSDGTVRLEGRFALLPERAELPLVMESVSLSRGAASSTAEGAPADPRVDAMSELLGDLSRRIARAVESWPPEEKPEDSQSAPESEEKPSGAAATAGG
jgi:uncharacterized lipoprotein YmbA